MSSAKVSATFGKFLAKKATQIEEAKKAENTMQTCLMPVGWKGQMVCVAAVADKGKDSKDDKGNTQEGREYVRLEFSVVNDAAYQGKKASLMWQIYDSANATATQRFEWMLNEMENLGLPRELRQGFNDFTEVLNHFLNSDEVYEGEVVHNSYRRGDQKELKVRRAAIVDNTTSMAPPVTSTSSPAPATTSQEPGSEVKYMGKMWEVVDQDGDTVVIKSKATGNNRTVKLTDLEG